MSRTRLPRVERRANPVQERPVVVEVRQASPAAAVVSDAKGKTKRAARKRAQAERRRFQKVHRAERYFGRQLRMVAQQVGIIVNMLAPSGVVENFSSLNIALERYADMLAPWAHAVARRSVEEVARRDLAAWASLGREIGRNLGAEIRRAPTGEVMRVEMDKRVVLIKSLPREAAQRVHRLVIEGMERSERAASTAVEIAETGKVTKSRAMLIARTETTSCATAMVEARHRSIGGEEYVWETTGDADVREEHKHLQGKVVKWDEPPIAGTGKGGVAIRYHAGAGPNCRCWPRPLLPLDVL